MLKFILKRLVAVVITLLVISFLTFILMHIAPGSPFASEKGLSPTVLAALNKRYGLDQNILVQYWKYLYGLLHFNFGVSFKLKGETVNHIINQGFRYTAIIGGLGTLIVIIIGIPLGVLSALKHDKFFDRASMLVSVLGVTVPSFVFASLYQYFFAIKYHLVPIYGVTSFLSYVGPAICIAVFSLAFVTRLTRSSMLEVLQQDYIRTAKAKGLSSFRVLFKHSLRNALIPVVSYLGPMIAGILTGSFVIESIFSIPGIGKYYTTSVSQRDFTLIMGLTMFYAVFLVFAVFIVDILYVLIDPRIKYEKD